MLVNMKKEKGFTLIELLAVIVILAVIALIAVPIILNIVEKARKSSFEDSAYGIMKSAQIFYSESLLSKDNLTEDKTFIFDGTDSELNFSGSMPKGGSLTLTKEGKVSLAIYDENWCASKGIHDTKVTVTKYEEGKCIIPDTAKNPVISLKGDSHIRIKQNESYTEQGVEAKTVDGTILTPTITIIKNGEVVANIDTSVYGVIYEITYEVESNNKKVSVTRTVEILDGIGPVITVDPKEITLTLAEVSNYNIYNGISVTDNIDGSIEVNSTNVKVEGSLSASVGTYEITYMVTDSAGNISRETRTVNVTDTEGPILNFSSINTNGYVKEVDVIVTAVDDNELTSFTYEITKDNESQGIKNVSVNGKNAEQTITLNETGIYTIKLTASDNQNNTSELESGEYKIDGDGPNISFTDNIEIETEEVVNYDIYNGVTITDNVDGNIEVNSTNVKVEGSLTKTLGKQTISYTVSDSLGNTSTKIRTFHIVDKTDPTITIEPNEQEEYVQSKTITITANDNVSINSLSYVLINNGTRGESTPITSGGTITLNTTGNYQIEVTAIDSSNNDNIITSGTYKIDSDKPVITVPENTIIKSNEVGNYNPLTDVTVTDNTGEVIIPTTSGSLDALTLGEQYITYHAKDASGNEAVEVRRKFTVVESEGPSVNVSSIPSNWVKEATVTLVANDPSGLKSFTYEIKKDTGETYKSGSGTISGIDGTASVTLNEEGIYYITLNATDIYGTSNETSGSTYGPYKIDRTLPELVVNPTSIELKDTEVEGYDLLAGVSATDNNGTPTIEYSPTSISNTPGTYTITYTAKDEAGNEKQETRTIIVKFPEKWVRADTSLHGAEGNVPSVSNGLVPIKYVTAEDQTNKWYDYDNQMWANAASVTEEYRNVPVGTPIPEEAVLAYFVWIPRYEYQYTNLGTNYAGGTQAQPGEIKINFVETSDTTPSTNYKIHPAFTFGTTQLAGFWVGKFETSAQSGSTCYTTASTNNCDNANQSPRIKPNVPSLRYQIVSNQFATAQKFSASGNSYGIATTADAHMMKNSEWGAVAYLSQSKYGKYGNSSYSGANKEVYINNYWSSPNTLTGCSAGAPSTGKSTSCSYTYEKSLGGTGASTTGTIYGVYDMSGGAYEYVMGYYSGHNPSTWGATSSSNYAGFSGTPNSKYYDNYATENVTTACNSGICYGHALSETSRWYSDYAYFVAANSPWFIRGGYYSGTTGAGVFGFNRSYGTAYGDSSFRVVALG